MSMRTLASALCALGLACSRGGATAPIAARSTLPSREATQPTADQILNDAYLVPAGDRTGWLDPEVDAEPGAIQIGRTMRADLLERFGYPTQRRTTDEGDEIWIYASALRPHTEGGNPVTTRKQSVAAQRKVVVRFAKGSVVVTEVRTYVSGERHPDPLRGSGAPFPDLEPPIIGVPSEPTPAEPELEPIQPIFP